MSNAIVTFVMAVMAIIFFAALAALFQFIPVYFLWNWLCPKLFGLPVITFWQALGISILTSLLFKGSCSQESK
ncbi:MAG: hypothetical protein IT167_31880 [Bryobacterales bacterium]|nr:hypothetical protein [Bryobacterales bacterium]